MVAFYRLLQARQTGQGKVLAVECDFALRKIGQWWELEANVAFRLNWSRR